MKTRNSDRLKEILGAKRNQIVALKDIQMYLLETNPEVATKISYQIDREEEVYKNLLRCSATVPGAVVSCVVLSGKLCGLTALCYETSMGISQCFIFIE